MKKITKYLLLVMLFLLPQVVLAAPDASIKVSANSIENGQSVTLTVTMTNTAAWNIKMQGSGAATCSRGEADATADGNNTTKEFTLTCTATQEGTINFSVTGDITSDGDVPETKDINLTKQVTVIRAKSSDNTLSDLKVDGTTVSGFSASKTSYIVSETAADSINITATTTDSKASISGTGSKSLKYGKNSFNVVVTAENGSTKTYTITINRTDSRSSNNYLKSLSIDKANLQFNKDATTYEITVEHEISEISIFATAEDSKATVSGTGKKTLENYLNEFTVTVKAENGSEKKYVIRLMRKDELGNTKKLSQDNSVNSITITGYPIQFDNNVKKYNILVEDINELDIKVVPTNENSTVKIENNTNLVPGLNVVKVQVLSETGDINEFTFNVYKIGEEQEQKEEPVEKPKEEEKEEPKEEEEKDGLNIWLIIAGIEFLALIAILLLYLKNKKDNEDSDDDSSNDNNVDETSEQELPASESEVSSEVVVVGAVEESSEGEAIENQESTQEIVITDKEGNNKINTEVTSETNTEDEVVSETNDEVPITPAPEVSDNSSNSEVPTIPAQEEPKEKLEL